MTDTATATQRPTTPIVNSVGGKLLAAVLQEIRNLDRPWPNTPESEQQRVIDRVRTAVDAAVRGAVNSVAQCGFAHAVGSLESLGIKDGVKAQVKFARTDDAVHTLMDAVGTMVLIVFADHNAFTAGMERIKADVDQPELPLGEPRLRIDLGDWERDDGELLDLLAATPYFDESDLDVMAGAIACWSDQEAVEAKAWAAGGTGSSTPIHLAALRDKARVAAGAAA